MFEDNSLQQGEDLADLNLYYISRQLSMNDDTHDLTMHNSYRTPPTVVWQEFSIKVEGMNEQYMQIISHSLQHLIVACLYSPHNEEVTECLHQIVK